ncbi:DUF3857 domain-containing protein [Flavobacterium amniphilum]|uniref:DUF3857 domain-containing protein n=1 Tax=Flavobacterium amniphilum TaxID=1834035 RepID=UPI002029B73C|nr:DUF3857 domain-containing protein [Flavobacterium amniphilum]MCL9806722.1 DUF3857 domain-containing protein [Flavobacterium amniphilum]
MKLSVFVTVFFFLAANPLFSQKMDLGDVTVNELKEKRHPKDSSAAAAILFKNAVTRFYYNADRGFFTKTEFEYKIKIYRKDGLNWANFVIPYYTGTVKSDEENIEVNKAVVYNLENGKIVKSKPSADAKVEKSINDYWDTKTVIFPNVREGSIIELKYTHKSWDFDVLPSFQFQYDIPVNQAEFVTAIPEFYKYKIVKKSEVPFTLDQNYEPGSQNYVELAQPKSIVYTQLKSVFKFKDIPALIEEDYAGNIDNYYGKIEQELESVTFEDQKAKNISKTWDDIGKLIVNNKEYKTELSKNSYFINDLKALLKESKDQQVNMNLVFDFVKKRMSWNGKNGFFLNNPIEQAYSQKTGNAAEINFILLSMLKLSGVDANPVFMSTKDFGYANYPNKSKLNYVLVNAVIDGKNYILDATDKMSAVNLPPVRALNWSGTEVKKDGTTNQIKLFTDVISKESTNVMGSINASGEITGMMKVQKSDYEAVVFRDDEGKLAQEPYLERLEKEFKGSEISEYKVENKTDLEKPVVETLSFKNHNAVEIMGDKMYFQPLLFFAMTENPFKQEKREYPVDFVYPNQKKYLTIINIPEGYVVESMPEPVSIVFPNSLLAYKFNINSNGKQIQLTSVFDTNTSIIAPEDYEELKKFFSEVIKKQTEKVVLKKA